MKNMRNKNRLDDFYKILHDIHKQRVPDWRFGQFVLNISKFSNKDLWLMEEDEFIECLEKAFKIKNGVENNG